MSFVVVLLFVAHTLADNCGVGEWCRFGYAFVGTGRGNNRDFVDAASQIPVLGTFTIEAWIWASDATSNDWKTIVSRAPRFWAAGATSVPNVFTDFNVQVDDEGRLSFFMGNGMASPWQYGLLLLSNRTVPSQQWVHAAVVVSALGGSITPFEATMYLDGVVVDTDVWGDGARQYLPNEPIRVSRYDNTDPDRQYWDGKIDELRIWPTARSQQDIIATMFVSLNQFAAADLTLYYKFDVQARDNQTIVPDQSGNNHDGVLQHDGPIAPTYFDQARICGRQQ